MCSVLVLKGDLRILGKVDGKTTEKLMEDR